MMDVTERLLDQTPSPLERALLLEGRAYRAPDSLRTHVLSALGLPASVGLVASVLAWLSAKTWKTKLVLALSTATLAVGIPVSYVLLTRGAPASQPAAPALVALPTPAAPPDPAPSAGVSAPAPVRTADPPAAPPAPARASGNTNSALRAELAALDAVRSALASGDPAGALPLLAAYFRTFPRGRLHYEAEVLRIDALAKAGQLDTAKRYAQEFLKRHPNSVLAARVRTYAER
jgi:hypothetical protein